MKRKLARKEDLCFDKILSFGVQIFYVALGTCRLMFDVYWLECAEFLESREICIFMLFTSRYLLATIICNHTRLLQS